MLRIGPDSGFSGSGTRVLAVTGKQSIISQEPHVSILTHPTYGWNLPMRIKHPAIRMVHSRLTKRRKRTFLCLLRSHGVMAIFYCFRKS